ncbi:hypothetical protein HAX54_019385, partial [Datura stramonium]|nr:hypothetical protein [Datura stramonium]
MLNYYFEVQWGRRPSANCRSSPTKRLMNHRFRPPPASRRSPAGAASSFHDVPSSCFSYKSL